MIRSKVRFKVLGLCAVVLGLMAFSAGVAQAEEGANWKVAGSNVTTALLPSVDIGEIEEGKASLLTEISGAKVRYECKTAKLIGVKLELNGSLTNGGKVKFTECETFLNGALSAVCVPKTTGLANGEIESLAGKGLLVLHKNAAGENEGLTRIEPKEGETFLTLKHSPPCALPENVPVRGKLFIKDCKPKAEPTNPCVNGVTEERVSHLIVQGPLTHLWVISLTPEHAANIDGSATAILVGGLPTHAGLEWSGIPG